MTAPNRSNYAYEYAPPSLNRDNENMKLCFVMSSTRRTKYEMEMRREAMHKTPPQDLFAYCRSGNWPGFIHICQEQPKVCAWISPYGQNLLHFILQRRPSVESVIAVEKLAPDALMKEDIDGCLPIHMAMTNGASHDVLTLLILICPESVKVKNRWGYTPYEWIIERCLYEILTFDPSNASDNASKAMIWNTIEVLLRALTDDNSKKTILHLTTEFDCPLNLLKAILNEFPWMTAVHDDYGRLPIASAVTAPASIVSARFIRLLVSIHPGALLAKDDDGRCPLHLAIDTNRDWGVLKFLIKSYPDCIQAQDGLTNLYPFMLLASKDASLSAIIDAMSFNVGIFNEAIDEVLWEDLVSPHEDFQEHHVIRR